MRLLHYVSVYAVNLPYGDQWDYLSAVFQGAHSWDLFRLQHGPHRMGLGLIFDKMILESFAWDVRAESFFIVGLMIVSSLLSLALKYRLFLHLSWADITIPLVFLHLASYELLIVVPNPSHGPLPLMLLMLLALTVTMRRFWFRVVSYLLLDFLLIYTGFGIFVGLLVPLVLLYEFFHRGSIVSRQRKSLGLLILLAAMLILVSFFCDYRFSTASSCQRSALENPINYFRFFFMLFNKFVGIFQPAGVFFTLGSVGTILAAAFVGYRLGSNANRENERRDQIQRQSIVIGLLFGFTLLFAIGTTLGRACLETVALSLSSRYTPYIMPGMLAFYFALCTIKKKQLRNLLLLCFIGLLAIGHVRNYKRDLPEINHYSSLKRSFIDCYLTERLDPTCSNQKYGLLHPAPQSTRMSEMLEFFREERLSFFNR